MRSQRIIDGCDKVMAFSTYAIIYFLPISSALIESFFSLALISFFIKRFVRLFDNLRGFELQDIVSGQHDLVKAVSSSFGLPKSPLNQAIGCYIFLNFLSIFNSLYPMLSLKGFFFKLLQETFTFFIIIECINTPKRLKLFLTVFLISFTLIITDGLFQAVTRTDFIFHQVLSDNRVTASFRHGNDFGGYLVFVLPVLFSLIFWTKVIRKKGQHLNEPESVFKIVHSRKFFLFILFLCLLSVLCLGLTLSRGAWIAFIFSMFILCIRNMKFLLVLLLLIIVFAVIFFPLIIHDRNMTSMWMDSGRLAYWREAWHIIRDYPVLGTGLNTYSEVGREYKIVWGGYPHNCFLQLTSELGSLGLISFLFILFKTFHEGLRAIQNARTPFFHSLLVGSLGGFVGYLVHSMFDTNFYSIQLGSYLWIILGIVISTANINEVKNGPAI